MASGFIVLKDGRCFGRRWTGYDEILRIVIKELFLLDNGIDLAKWLDTQLPDLDDADDDSGECGWGFYQTSTDQFLNRHLDLRSLTDFNQELFVKAIFNGRIKLLESTDKYSPLDIDFFEIFYRMVVLTENGEPPLEFSDWGIVKPCNEKNGPGWEILN